VTDNRPRLSTPRARPPAPAEHAARTDGPSARSSAVAPLAMEKREQMGKKRIVDFTLAMVMIILVGIISTNFAENLIQGSGKINNQ